MTSSPLLPKETFMKNKLIYLLLPFVLFNTSCNKENVTGNTDSENTNGTIKPVDNESIITYELDYETNLRNPYMGWVLYTEGISNAFTYWTLQKEAVERYASTFYIRCSWSNLETEEGKYAWENDENFKALVKGALDNGLRLAFRVVTDSRDGSTDAVPEYVLKDGNYFTEYERKTPYPNNPYFLEKYTKFIEAFGKAFNDPSKVDYIDCAGIGKWGEEHTFVWQPTSNGGLTQEETYKKISEAYAKAFDKVINITNYQAGRSTTVDSYLYNDIDFSLRRDGYVSSYFPPAAQVSMTEYFPKKVIVAEACYWHTEPQSGTDKAQWKGWQDYYVRLVDLALETHANYLDMRTPTETSRLLQNNRDDVKRFVSQGGYRIYPKRIAANIKDSKITLDHTWQNVGVGVLPNNNKNLRFKYKVSFALFNESNEMVQQWYSDKVEVSELVGNKQINGQETFDMDSLAAGTYKLGVGIVNTLPNDSKDIKLAIKHPNVIQGEWVYICDVEYK